MTYACHIKTILRFVSLLSYAILVIQHIHLLLIPNPSKTYARSPTNHLVYLLHPPYHSKDIERVLQRSFEQYFKIDIGLVQATSAPFQKRLLNI
jgi:hypothetical protein